MASTKDKNDYYSELAERLADQESAEEQKAFGRLCNQAGEMLRAHGLPASFEQQKTWLRFFGEDITALRAFFRAEGDTLKAAVAGGWRHFSPYDRGIHALEAARHWLQDNRALLGAGDQGEV